jgi:selenocysteine lyase/cysteine desulfurase
VTTSAVSFIDLQAGEDAPAVRDAIDRVIASGWFVLGPEVEAFEAEFATASGARAAIGVGNGTDAIALLLRAVDIGRGDEVIVPAMTAAFTALAVTAIGATPVFADVDAHTLTIDPDAVAAAITSRTRAIVPVHLYGQAADLDPLFALAENHSLVIVEDCCQSHLATHRSTPVGTRGIGGAFSFYPTKNLGALGRRRRRHHQRRDDCRSDPAAAQWRPAGSVSSRRRWREQPARRAAGRGASSQAPLLAEVDRATTRTGQCLSRRPAGRRSSRGRT